MSDHTPQLVQAQLPFDEIPYGYCHCGCGQKTIVSSKNDASHGWKKGQPRKFLAGHSLRQPEHELDYWFWLYTPTKSFDECWEWQGAKKMNGYGWIHHKRIGYLAHRLSYEIHFGKIPDGLFICHKCDNPICVNPHHLFAGTSLDNGRDRHRKGRTRGAFEGGVKHPNAKLTSGQVEEIRALQHSGLFQREVGARYGVTRTTIASIWSGATYLHRDTPGEAKRALLALGKGEGK